MNENFELFEKSGNKSIEEIEEMLNIAETSIRLYASRHLVGHGEDNPKDICATLNSHAFGISEIDKPHVTKIFQDEKEGIICVQIEGDYYPCDFDEFDLYDKMDIIRGLA